MGYTNIRAAIKQWYPHTKKLKYCLYAKFDEHSNKFGKGWSHDSNMLNVKDTYDLPTIKMDIYYHPLIKEDLFEATVTFSQRFTPILIINYYCQNHNMTYITQ